ncbi:type II toxin-antitoxin system RelE/ParE family toxin [Vibrio sinaloensis]|uniref:type II toxin-antitoxin system RelE/ParE family toxin n=1 Tax=Photobacterium sp. (strain ATCC 43367) TaxID=379097 RepID=UPI00206D973C|nr:type II toxin-antitoxin system RelE/ParE family toxin [Vibrio sinaloensis]UPQ86916.1 type II toxin-antitoxin system RelE/ParE family toxin [Vibrio sinaloensis]
MEVIFTEMAVNCLLEIESLAGENYSAGKVAAFTDGLVNRNHDAISENPERYRYNATLLDFGIKFQERLDSSYRCLYEVIDNKAYVMLILHTKQDLISALYRHQILRNLN